MKKILIVIFTLFIIINPVFAEDLTVDFTWNDDDDLLEYRVPVTVSVYGQTNYNRVLLATYTIQDSYTFENLPSYDSYYISYDNPVRYVSYGSKSVLRSSEMVLNIDMDISRDYLIARYEHYIYIAAYVVIIVSILRLLRGA